MCSNLDFQDAFRASRIEGPDLVQFYSFFLEQSRNPPSKLYPPSKICSRMSRIESSILSFLGFTLATDVEVDEGSPASDADELSLMIIIISLDSAQNNLFLVPFYCLSVNLVCV